MIDNNEFFMQNLLTIYWDQLLGSIGIKSSIIVDYKWLKNGL